ncbi:MAG: class I SAM-dependent methyltransferase [Thermosynechococcaceae cyanobacterium]
MAANLVENYGWKSVKGPCSCGYITPKILQLLQQLSVKRVLDLGAGNGALCGELAAAGYEVAGVEYDHTGVEIASASHPNIKFYRFGVQDNPAELMSTERPFDAVVSTEVIEHLFSPHLLPIFAKGTLRAGGYLIITTPYHGYLKNLLLSLFGKWDEHLTALWHGGHIKFWSRPTLTQLLTENGFQVVGFSGTGRLPYLWKSMIVVAQKT